MKNCKGFVVGLLTGLILAISITVFAEYINVEFNKVALYVNSVRVKGDTIFYNDVTYVPLRTVGEMLNKDVFWDKDMMTATINDKRPKTDYITRGYRFTSLDIGGDSYYSKVMGEIENTTTRNRTQVVFTFNFYDKNNRLIGTANAVIDNLAKNEKRSFSAYGDPVKGYANYTVQIDSEL